MRFINDDDIPVTFLQVGTIFGVLLQCIDGNNGPVKVVEGIVIGGNAGTHSLNAHGIKACKWYREAAPEFLLELREHAFDGENQNTLPFAPADKFRK